jgi:transcriptional antiterminator NusG
MIYDKDVWFVIRNTQGVLGFVGSSGKGAKPIPISESQYNNSLKKINDEKVFVEELITKSVKFASDDVLPTPEVKYDFIVGDIVEIEKGKFISNGGKIINIDKDSGLATIEINENDTTINIEVPLANLRK